MMKKKNAWEAIGDGDEEEDDAKENGDDDQVKSANSGWNKYRLVLHRMFMFNVMCAFMLCVVWGGFVNVPLG